MVEVYWVPVPETAVVDQVAGHVYILDPEELATYSRYRVDFKKVEFMTGRLLLKSLLAARLGTKPAAVRFAKSEYGRPYLHATHQQPGLCFNLSHTQGIVACVLSPWERVGIDVERPAPDHLEVMPSVFVSREIAFIEAQSSLRRKLSAFGLLWTRKEAVMKAAGMGFYLAPKSFTVPFGRVRAADAAYLYHTYRFDDDHVCSLALARGEGVDEPAPQVRRVDFATLVSGRFRAPAPAGPRFGKEAVLGAGNAVFAQGPA